MGYQYVPNAFPHHPPAEFMFSMLWHDLEWEKRPDAPRKECWMNDFGRPYTYGKGAGVRTYEAHTWNAMAADIRDDLVGIIGGLGHSAAGYFEGCFANGYDGQRDWLGWHADDDPGIDHTKPIVVVSFGQERAIQVCEGDWIEGKFMRRAEMLNTFMLGSGSVFVMPAGSQHTHVHRIPKVGHAIGPRLSLTFRGLLP